jgi:hypothetical protein
VPFIIPCPRHAHGPRRASSEDRGDGEVAVP